ncbi:sensor histidine kinase [Rhodohalobacter sp. 8-1]|uniref:sensor histidine kinase n=1 Tax=Rhodohalobacter sp. 8-1 TaxID=3131972 RepID=UPI0030EC2DFD
MATKSGSGDGSDHYDLNLFFESSADLLCISGFDGYFKKVNPALSELLGFTLDELTEKPINEFILPDDRYITDSYRERIRDGIPLLNFENRYITKEGDVVWLSWTSIPDVERGLVYAIAKNVTHNRKLSDDRNKLISSLTKKNSDLKQLTYSTSHDLRSPLGNIIGILSILDYSKIEDKETLELLDMLNISAEKMKQTLDQQIDSLRESERVVVDIREINLVECLKSTTDSIKSHINTSNTTIEKKFDVFDTVRFNHNYMESIFLNLITNSIRYSKPNEAPVINIRTRVENGVKQLIFTDNGIGMNMESVRGKIFGFNQTFHENEDGKGIGLYLVNNHVQAMGGSISVESEVGKGSIFTISFAE